MAALDADPTDAAGTARLPASAWAFGWSCVAVQLTTFLDRGVSSAGWPWVLLSMTVSALLVGWFASGILRAKRGRTVLVWLFLGVDLCLQVIGVLATPASAARWLDLVLALAQVASLLAFCLSEEHRVLAGMTGRADPAGLHALVAVALVAGAVGGLSAPAGGGEHHVQVRVVL